MTNIAGPENIVRAIHEHELPVETVVGISTDKACKPVNVMGMTKAIQERVFIQANMRCAQHPLHLRPLRQRAGLPWLGDPALPRADPHGGPVTITSTEMTRFLLSLDQAVDTVFAAVARRKPGETYIPRVPSALVDRHRRQPHRRPADRDRGHWHPPRREDPRDTGLRGGGPPHGRPRRLLAILPMLPELPATGSGASRPLERSTAPPRMS